MVRCPDTLRPSGSQDGGIKGSFGVRRLGNVREDGG